MKLFKNIFITLIKILTFIPKYSIKGIKVFFSDNKQKNLKIEDKIIPIIITSLSIITYLICIFLLTRWFIQSERTQQFSDELIKETDTISKTESQSNQKNNNKQKARYNYKYPDDLSFLNVNLNPYIKINSETVAWIQVNGTSISYPVVQNKNNDFYLNHDFYKRKTDIGAIFADYRDNFEDFNENTIIYGHNIVNKTMFGQIPNLLYKNWQNHEGYHYIKLSTKKTNTIWQVFSTYEIKPTIDYLQSIFNSTDNYEKFLTLIKNRSNYNYNVEVTYEDKIITLSTCNNAGNKRVVVHAKLINLEYKK